MIMRATGGAFALAVMMAASAQAAPIKARVEVTQPTTTTANFYSPFVTFRNLFGSWLPDHQYPDVRHVLGLHPRR